MSCCRRTLFCATAIIIAKVQGQVRSGPCPAIAYLGMVSRMAGAGSIASCCIIQLQDPLTVCAVLSLDMVGYYSFWPGASSASAINIKTLIDAPNTETLQDCLTRCTFHNLCAGVQFGPVEPNTMNLQVIARGVPAIKCQLIQVQTVTSGSENRVESKSGCSAALVSLLLLSCI